MILLILWYTSSKLSPSTMAVERAKAHKAAVELARSAAAPAPQRKTKTQANGFFFARDGASGTSLIRAGWVGTLKCPEPVPCSAS